LANLEYQGRNLQLVLIAFFTRRDPHLESGKFN